MTFLELVVRLSNEAQIPGEGPATTVGLSGESRDLVNWVKSAWKEIQTAQPNWNWMLGEFSFTTTADQIAYTPAEAGISTRFSSWVRDSIKLYQTTSGEQNSLELDYVDYSTFRTYYKTNVQSTGRPVAYAVHPNRSLLIGPIPNATGYTVAGEYYKSVQTLALDADEPEMPEEYHEAIVWKALMKYARAEAAGEIYDDARRQYNILMSQLAQNQLPPIEMPEPLI